MLGDAQTRPISSAHEQGLRDVDARLSVGLSLQAEQKK
jgi:hypothetical protein